MPADDVPGDTATHTDTATGPHGLVGIVDLETGAYEARITGEAESDALRYAVPAGDLDGDGTPDLVVGSSRAEGSVADSGEVYVLYGPLSGTIPVTTADVRIPGNASDGLRPGPAGMDATGDGVPDLIVSGPSANAFQGLVYLFPGPLGATGLPADVYAYWGTGEGDAHRAAVTRFADLEGDGVPEVVLQDAYGCYVFDTPVATTGPQPNVYRASYTSDDLRTDAIRVEDVDGDGLADLLVGLQDNYEEVGGARLVYGPLAGDQALETAADVTFDLAEDATGVAQADLNGDGHGDVALGFSDVRAGTTNGEVYVSFGAFASAVDLAAADVVLTGEAEDDAAGHTVDVGDFDGDGAADLLVGAYADDAGGLDAGAAYVLYGPLLGSDSLAAAGAKVLGEATGDTLMAASAGDMDGDGAHDLLLAAPGDDTAARDAGAIYLVLGGSR